MKRIKDKLEEGFIDVVSFVCCLFPGLSSEGTLKEVVETVVEIKREVNEKKLLGGVINLLNKSGFDKLMKVERTFEIINLFLNKNFRNKDFIVSNISKCHGDHFSSNISVTEHVCQICRHLNICGCDEDDIRMAFTKVLFDGFEVSKCEQLHFIAVKNCFCIGDYSIGLVRMKTSLNSIREKFGEEHINGYIGGVDVWDCEFHDEMIGCDSSDRLLVTLVIGRCKFKTESSFIDVCEWGMVFEEFVLWCLAIDSQWWEILVTTLEQRNNTGDVGVKELCVRNCTTEMNHDLAMKIVQCGVVLEIDDRKLVL